MDENSFSELSDNPKINLTNEQRKILNSKRTPMEVSVFEAAIIKQLRSMLFGQLTVHLLDGVAVRYTIGASVTIDPTSDAELLREAVQSNK